MSDYWYLFSIGGLCLVVLGNVADSEALRSLGLVACFFSVFAAIAPLFA